MQFLLSLKKFLVIICKSHHFFKKFKYILKFICKFGDQILVVQILPVGIYLNLFSSPLIFMILYQHSFLGSSAGLFSVYRLWTMLGLKRPLLWLVFPGEQVLASGWLSRCSTGSLVLDLVQIRTMHHNHFSAAQWTAANHCQVLYIPFLPSKHSMCYILGQ